MVGGKFFNHPLVKIFFSVFFTFLFLFIFFIIVFLVVFNKHSTKPTLNTIPKNSIGVIKLEGFIYRSENIIKNLKNFVKNPNIKAIIIKINSPGGAVAPSQEIYSEILKLKKEKRIYAYFQSIAASGGYYVGCACDKIIANPGSLTGSIGVIMEFPNFKELLDKIGIKGVVIKSGKFKDTGNPARDFTLEEKKYLQSVVFNVYNQFLKAVAKNRNIPIEKLKKIADGRIFSGEQAFNFGLVDKLGNFDDAISLVKKECKIKGEPELVYPPKKTSLFKVLIEGVSETIIKNIYNNYISLKYILPLSHY